MFAINNVVKSYGHFKIGPISFELDKNDFLSIIGSTGSGKTSILDLITGIKSPDEGSIILNGKNILNEKIHKRDISIVYQDSFLFPHFNVQDNIKYGLKYKKTKGFDFDYIVKLFKIEHLLKRRVNNLSGGERQRIAIARAIIVKPSLLLLDEPLSSIDESLKAEMVKLIRKVHDRLELTTIMVTHNLNDIWRLSNKVLLIKNGRMLQFGSVEDIFYKPMNREVASFVKMTNILNVRFCSNKILLGSRTFDFVSIGKDSGMIGIRPEDIKISFLPINDFIYIKAKVVDIVNEGYFFSVYLKNDTFSFHSILSKSEFEGMNIKIESEVYVNFHRKKVHVFN